MLLLVAACTRPPPPVAIPAPAPRSDALWFVLVDRFADGRPDAPGTIDRADPAAWHGGDLPGLTARLPYLRSLGMGGLWISPVTDTRDAPLAGHGAFHGYWTEDPRAIEPRLGTEADLEALADALHDHGESLWVDVVWNHVGYDAPLAAARPDWFHGKGDVSDWDDPVQVVEHDVHGLPDLAQERPEVAAWLAEGARWLQDRSAADGFRVDAVRHLAPGFVAALGDELRARSPRPFGLLGEVFDGDPGRVAARARTDRLDQVFDFPLHYALVESICGDRPLPHVAANLPPTLGGAFPVTLVDNHDLPRIASRCGGPEGAARALAVNLGMRGRPALTWGTEHALPGAGEPENRADQPWEAGDGVLAPALRAMLAFRARHPAMVDGESRTAWLDAETWTLWRVDPDETVVVIVNRGPTPIAADPRGLPGEPSESLAIDGVTARPGVDEVPPDGVWWGVYPGPAPAVATSTPALAVEGAPPGAVRWAGTTTALGGWDPSLHVAGAAEVPDGTVLLGKAVVHGPDGSVTWDPGPDRVLVVGEGRGPWSGRALAVTWGR